ncbi:mitochondrial inner membrane protease subunit 2-like [Leptopilina heterotoma]|uniref:mitochondrial inner membrane protease subunit 2-like n=1 Tax=Leptopilina heterotoma TaxID=63436 RepID=UPI001CA98CAA|nr:mitochondrial inner membrane protease subunit 2-like [Leptopilina heterotoma]
MAILFNLYRILLGTAVGFAFKPCILDTFGTIVRVDGKSMQPTLNPDTNNVDFIFLNRWAIRNYDINRGDIITFVSPNAPDRHIIKRVVGLAGDVISTIGYKTEVVKVPNGYCWVEGDHTGFSLDSNSFGPIALSLLIGKATYIVWPPSRWQHLISVLPSHRTPLNLTCTEVA